ncbi:MAG TPA: hypothetical protein VMH33_00270 [Solirubrobacterales bacterium]|nr:hypothetical protein [Solirubrobacterales bacterium]
MIAAEVWATAPEGAESITVSGGEGGVGVGSSPPPPEDGGVEPPDDAGGVEVGAGELEGVGWVEEPPSLWEGACLAAFSAFLMQSCRFLACFLPAYRRLQDLIAEEAEPALEAIGTTKTRAMTVSAASNEKPRRNRAEGEGRIIEGRP